MKYFGLNSDCGKLYVCKAGSILLSLILAVKNKSNPNKTSSRMSSEYEYIVAELLVKERKRLEELQKNAEKNKSEIEELTNRLSTTQSLFENYNMGMNYFRRAKGGRSGLRE